MTLHPSVNYFQKLLNLSITETMQTNWLKMLDISWDKNIHPTQMIMISGLIGCVNISINFRSVKALEFLISP